MMTGPDHYAISIRCRHKAEAEMEQNDLLTAAEMMWGAVVHAIKLAIPQYTNRPLHSHRDMQRAVREAAPYFTDFDLRQYFGHGEALHRYFYRLDIPDHQVSNNFRQCQRFLDLLLPGPTG